jgi:site-specific DNA recombinase
MKTAVAYCRTANALRGEPLEAVKQQARAIRRYAKGRGVTICETYMDAGVSGATLDRIALQRLLADCRAGKVGTVLVQDSDRLSRDTGQLIELLGSFVTAGVQVEFSTQAGRDQYAFFKVFVSALTELGQAQRKA